MDPIIIVLVGVIFFLLHFILLARCSHWAHATQAKLDETNRLLKALADRGGAP